MQPFSACGHGGCHHADTVVSSSPLCRERPKRLRERSATECNSPSQPDTVGRGDRGWLGNTPDTSCSMCFLELSMFLAQPTGKHVKASMAWTSQNCLEAYKCLCRSAGDHQSQDECRMRLQALFLTYGHWQSHIRVWHGIY